MAIFVLDVGKGDSPSIDFTTHVYEKTAVNKPHPSDF